MPFSRGWGFFPSWLPSLPPQPPPQGPPPRARPQCPGIARLGEGPRAGRMSPHGKRAGGQALGQPRPPPSTPRAPDRGPCELRGAPRSPWSSAPGLSLRVAWHPTGAHPSPPAFQGAHCPHPPWLVKHRKIPGAVPGLPSSSSLLSLPPPEQRRPGRLPSGCSVTQPRRRRLPCSSAGRDVSRGRDSGCRCKPLRSGFQAVTPLAPDCQHAWDPAAN